MITEAIIEVLLSVVGALSGVSSVLVEKFFRKKKILKDEKKKQESLSK